MLSVSFSTYRFTLFILRQIYAREAQLVTDDVAKEDLYEEHKSQVGKIRRKA